MPGADECRLYLQTASDFRPYLGQMSDFFSYKLLVTVVYTWGR
jgi:hypothetical protein